MNAISHFLLVRLYAGRVAPLAELINFAASTFAAPLTMYQNYLCLRAAWLFPTLSISFVLFIAQMSNPMKVFFFVSRVSIK